MCSNGLEGVQSTSNDVCCVDGCGVCGGVGCTPANTSALTAGDCCASEIVESGVFCDVSGAAPCIVTTGKYRNGETRGEGGTEKENTTVSNCQRVLYQRGCTRQILFRPWRRWPQLKHHLNQTVPSATLSPPLLSSSPPPLTLRAILLRAIPLPPFLILSPQNCVRTFFFFTPSRSAPQPPPPRTRCASTARPACRTPTPTCAALSSAAISAAGRAAGPSPASTPASAAPPPSSRPVWSATASPPPAPWSPVSLIGWLVGLFGVVGLFSGRRKCLSLGS